jgi:hypothetical protein
MVEAHRTARPDAHTVVLVDATVPVSRAAHGLGCRVVLVQRPGAPVHELVGEDTDYYSVEWEDESFADFVDTVLRPRNPTAVLSLTSAGAMAAATANSMLGTRGIPVDVAKAMAAAGDGEGEGGRRRIRARTFSSAGAHRWVAAVTEGHTPSLPGDVVPEQCLSAAEHRAALAAVTDLLDTAGLTDGPALVRLELHERGVRILTAEPTADDDEETELIRRLTGFDLVRRSLEWPLGTSPAPHGKEGGR